MYNKKEYIDENNIENTINSMKLKLNIFNRDLNIYISPQKFNVKGKDILNNNVKKKKMKIRA